MLEYYLIWRWIYMVVLHSLMSNLLFFVGYRPWLMEVHLQRRFNTSIFLYKRKFVTTQSLFFSRQMYDNYFLWWSGKVYCNVDMLDSGNWVCYIMEQFDDNWRLLLQVVPRGMKHHHKFNSRIEFMHTFLIFVDTLRLSVIFTRLQKYLLVKVS